MHNMSVQHFGKYPAASKPEFIFYRREDNLIAECCDNGKEYSLDKHTVHILPYSDFDLTFEETIRELLMRNYVPSIQNERLIWTHPKQNVATRICDLLSKAKKQMIDDKFDEAIISILEARDIAFSDNVEDPLGKAHFLEKIDRKMLKTLSKNGNVEVKRLLLQKSAVRRIFEKYLLTLTQESRQIKTKPSCFVCFSFGESEITEWLEERFVPDLDCAGIEPLVCFKQFGPGKILNRFQERIRTADRVAIICTEALKQKCEEREDAPQGVAIEIEFAEDRRGDISLRETTYPVYLKGDYSTACPSVYFKSILGTNFTFFDRSTPANLFNYYGASFELFGSMRKN